MTSDRPTPINVWITALTQPVRSLPDVQCITTTPPAAANVADGGSYLRAVAGVQYELMVRVDEECAGFGRRRQICQVRRARLEVVADDVVPDVCGPGWQSVGFGGDLRSRAQIVDGADL